MTTITKEFTKEQLIEQAKKNIEVLRVAVERVPGAYDAAVIHLKLAEITLASLEAKPIGAFHIAEQQVDGTSDYIKDGEWPIDNGIIEVYAAPPVPVIQADVAQAIENLKQKLVECNRYNYCADAVKGVEDASRLLAHQNQNMSAPITPEAIENAIEYIRSIAFHIDEDDYHGKHIAYFMRQALAWLEGHSCSNDRLGKAENQTVRGNQAAESNRGNEWTGNPDIDNAIIMLDRIDTLESCDDDRIEAVKAVLRRLAGNYPDSSEQAPGNGVPGERIRIKPHVYRELVNRLHDTAIKCAGTQQLRERISRVLGDVITPDHHKQAEKSGLERCHLEAALNIKPGHTLGVIDAMLVHEMAKALLPLVADKIPNKADI
ncbi:hypothetical protein [Escherichia albertii]|uniref:hypothetical protein n=1 Tax=Escherichia albertii TaxID=208962 RepID=UPI00223F64F1|nr:hypothetical protein [Escherichia albertii]QTA24226.1 hypothetical protein FYK18_25715 [Escherichia albertii]